MTTGSSDRGAFEERLRKGLVEASRLADTSQGPEGIADRARRQGRRATAGIVGGVAVLSVLAISIALVLLPDRTGEVVLDSVPPTATAPLGTERVPNPPPTPGQLGERPEARLVAAIEGRLVLTDLDGRVEGEAAWQPTGRDRIAEVVTDGETVVTWQPPCTLEAGSLVHGTSVPLGTDGACNGPAAIDETTGTIMWLSGPSASAAGEERSVAWFEQTATSARAGEVVMPGLLEADDRVVGIDGQEGSARLLVRRTGANWVEVLALPMQQLDDGTWEPRSGPGDAVELRPAFTHADGFVPLDVAGDWVLDARWAFADAGGSLGVIEEVRLRAGDVMSSGSTSDVLPVDPTAVWFDAMGEATIWGHGDERDPMWRVAAAREDRTTFFGGTTSGGVSAAAFLPGSLTEPTIPAPPPLHPSPTPPPTAIDEG